MFQPSKTLSSTYCRTISRSVWKVSRGKRWWSIRNAVPFSEAKEAATLLSDGTPGSCIRASAV